MIKIRFECGLEDRWSPDYGPFDYAQITYDTLRVGPDGADFAFYDPEKGEWTQGDSSEWYSDIVIWSV